MFDTLSKLTISFLYLMQNFHTDIHQYKAHIDDLNDLTQSLVASYPDDDANKLKSLTEDINRR